MPPSSTPPSPGWHRYAAYGLPFLSREAIAGLQPTDAELDEKIPVHVELGPVPQSLAEAEAHDEFMQSNGPEYLFDWPPILRLLVQDGRHVRAEAADGRDPLHFWYNVLSLGASVAGFQRGHYPLHASAVVHEGAAIAFAGPPGAGKSTLLAALAGRGFSLLSDDLCLIRPTSNGNRVGQGPPDLRLLPDAVAHLDLDPAASVPPQAEVRKSVYRLGGDESRDVPLRRVYTLAFGDSDATPAIWRLSGWATMQALIENNRLCMRLDLLPIAARKGAFATIARLVNDIEIYVFSRPRDHGSFGRSLDLLVDHFSGPRGAGEE